MDLSRKEEIYAQIRTLLSELVEETKQEAPKPVSDEHVLRIYVADAFGTKERIGG